MTQKPMLSAQAPMIRDSVLKAENLTKRVTSPEGSLTIVHDVTFDIAPGESVAIVGASGAGKSTLLALLAGLDLPSEGRVLLEGQDLAQLNEDGRARPAGAARRFRVSVFSPDPGADCAGECNAAPGNLPAARMRVVRRSRVWNGWVCERAPAITRGNFRVASNSASRLRARS